MRIVIDFQACQTESRYRGVGRYSLSLAEYLVPLLLLNGHQVTFMFNRLLEDNESQKLISDRFGSDVDIAWFDPDGPVQASDAGNVWRLRAAEVLREALLIQLGADVVHIASLLPEGWVDNFAVSLGHLATSAKTVVTHYDLIPLAMREHYLNDPLYQKYYMTKVGWLKNADLLLCISEYTKKEAEDILSFPERKLVSMSSAVGSDFTGYHREPSAINVTLQRFGLENGQFFLYAPGGFDFRKNVNRLIEAFAGLPENLQRRYPLVIASKLGAGQREAWNWKAGDSGIVDGCFILTDYIEDSELKALYASCHAYIFPSLHEGFGLPVLEAMACGAAVIASDSTSIPEVIGDCPDALFDPYDIDDIRATIMRVAEDPIFHARLKDHSKQRVHAFSWARTARIAAAAINGLDVRSGEQSKLALPSPSEAVALVSRLAGCDGDPSDAMTFREKYAALMEGGPR